MGKQSLAVLLGSIFISMLGMNILTPFLPVYARTMGASSLEIGLVQSAFSIAGIAALLFVGPLSDRHGRTPFLAAGLAIMVLSSTGFLFAAIPMHLILLRFVQGFGASTHLVAAQAYLGDAAPSGGEGKWMGWFNAVLFAGMGAGPLVGGIVTDALSISAAFILLAVMNGAGLLVVLMFLKEGPRKSAARIHRSAAAPLKSAAMRGVAAYRMAIGLGTASLMAFVPLFANVRLGLSATLIGILMAGRIPVTMAQSYTGRLADNWNRRALVIWGGIGCALPVFLMPLTSGFWTLLGAYLVVTAGQAFGIPAANAYVVNEGRTYGMGACVTMFMMSMYVGNSIGPVMLGGIGDRLGIESIFYTASLCMAAGVLYFARAIPGSPDR